MTKMTVEYIGGLRCKATHGPSGETLITDAPVDNHGKGRTFSPTDLFATSMATCFATIMGIQAEILKLDISGMQVEAFKEMSQDAPRRIAKVTLAFYIPHQVDEKNKERLEKAALHCPVHKSLHPDVELDVSFHWKQAVPQ